eukprot:4803978-Pyramimonas_sp.AAC.1
MHGMSGTVVVALPQSSPSLAVVAVAVAVVSAAAVPPGGGEWEARKKQEEENREQPYLPAVRDGSKPSARAWQLPSFLRL